MSLRLLQTATVFHDCTGDGMSHSGRSFQLLHQREFRDRLHFDLPLLTAFGADVYGEAFQTLASENELQQFFNRTGGLRERLERHRDVHQLLLQRMR